VFGPVSVAMIIATLIAVAVLAVLLGRTLAVANSINGKAQVIATTGRGINTSTDSVIQLVRTNQTAESILASARPLQPSLGQIVSTADDINTLAGSINSTAGVINNSATGINNSAGSIRGSAATINGNVDRIDGTAGRINGLATDINGKAGDILDVALHIDSDAGDINHHLDDTIGIAHDIHGDTGNIVGQAGRARVTSSCIGAKLLAPPPFTTADCMRKAF
jgi:methyl-accepting chemotaxis protein